MLAIEFKADFENGVIKVPEEYQSQLCKHLKVIALMDEDFEKESVVQYSDEYLEEHWRELIVTANMGDDFEKSDVLQEERASFLMEKYK